MIGMKAKYLGGLRCEAMHVKSERTLLTDAPLDNKGRGEAFSPTDLLATSLAVCMMTILGITAEEKGLPLGEMEVEIEKVMGSGPRRVLGVYLNFTMQNMGWSEKEWTILKNAALACPVANSLHPDIDQRVNWTMR
jgi:putative redox protein